MPAVYTVIFTFRGKPLARQVKADTATEALRLWAKQTSVHKKIPEAVDAEKLIPLNNMTNVWSMSLCLGVNEFGQNETGVVIVVVTQIDAVYSEMSLIEK